MTIPDRADTIEFLTDPIAGHIDIAAQDFGEEQWWRLGTRLGQHTGRAGQRQKQCCGTEPGPASRS